MNAPLFAVSENGMIVRYDPSIIADPATIFDRMNRDFKTIKGFTSVNLYNGENLTQPFSQDWNITITSNSICTWGYLPKLIFNTTFEIMEFSGEIRVVPNFSRNRTTTENPSILSGTMFWDPIKATVDSDEEIKILFANNVVRNANNYAVTNYLIFQLFDKVNNQIIGNFLPPIPNVFNDAKICMGHAFSSNPSCTDSIGEIVQNSINSFYSSTANEDLINDSMNRREISSQLFGWNEQKQTAPLVGKAQRLIKVKVGNFLLDNLPYEN